MHRVGHVREVVLDAGVVGVVHGEALAVGIEEGTLPLVEPVGERDDGRAVPGEARDVVDHRVGGKGLGTLQEVGKSVGRHHPVLEKDVAHAERR